MFCVGTLAVDVRVICYSRVRERTSHSGPSYALHGWRIMTIIMTGKMRGEKIV